MTIYLLGKEPVFPPAQLAEPSGIIAVGGDLSPQRLLTAYASGIFPWFSEDDPLVWWSPDPRMIVQPGDLHISESMQKLMKKNKYEITFDQNFKGVIQQCAAPRDGQPGTWITPAMKKAYQKLHRLGFAHSVEVWDKMVPCRTKRVLVGGLYGISLGKCFFGESMFSRRPNVSKLAFFALAQTLFKRGFLLLDCQLPTEHLKSLGAKEVSREDFLALLQTGINSPSLIGKWDFPVYSPANHSKCKIS